MTELRVGVIGTGWGGRLHLEGFRRSPLVKVVAIAGRTLSVVKEVANHYGIERVYQDYREMLNQESLDIVSVATPPPLHYEMTMAAVEAKAHVLCDKPLAMTSIEAEKMYRLAEHLSRKHATGFVTREDPAILKLKQLVSEKAVGDVLDIQYRAALNTPLMPMNWTYDREMGGGALMQRGPHAIDRMRWILGEEIVKVMGDTKREVMETVMGPTFHNVSEAFSWFSKNPDVDRNSLEKAEITADTAFHFFAEFESGVRGLFWESWHTRNAQRERIEIHGTDGTLVWNGGNDLFQLINSECKPILVENKHHEKIPYFYLWGCLAHGFANDILSMPSHQYSTFYDGWQVQRVIDPILNGQTRDKWLFL